MFISLVIASISWSVNPPALGKTASGLPSSGRAANTSTRQKSKERIAVGSPRKLIRISRRDPPAGRDTFFLPPSIVPAPRVVDGEAQQGHPIIRISDRGSEGRRPRPALSRKRDP